MEKSKILFNIDEIRVEKGLFVRGWFFSTIGKKITFKNEIENIKKYKREDVKQYYHEYEGALESGVELTLPLKKTKLIITDGSSEEIFEINPWKIILEDKVKEINDYYKLINLNNVQRGVRFLAKNGFKKTHSKLKNVNKSNELNYMEWLANHLPKKEELAKQRKHKFDYEPKISIVTPTWNTKKEFLIDMIESVRNQTYSNWELCLADGASTNKDTLELLKEYEEKDKRIKVKYLDKNYMISGNTNEALTLVTGDYIGLFDHDDLLTKNCLYEMIKAINENNEAKFLYSDEDKIDENGKNNFNPHFKPDWSPDTLRSYNYICHFTIFKKELLNKVGTFRSEYDGSQDHDLILRLTEVLKDNEIVHVPKILYHWRVHRNSTAGGAGAKSYTNEAGKRAVKSHLERQGIEGEVKNGFFPNSYKIDYKINDNPLVSIIIPNKDSKSDLKLCIDSILQKSTYKNLEIIVVENNSTSDEIFEYYEEIEKQENIKVVHWKKSGFNYSAINNYGAEYASGKYFILLNNDIEVISENWIEEMLMHCQKKEVGIVGAKLYYPEDSTIQHAGVVVGIRSVAGHIHNGIMKEDPGYMGRAKIVQNLSAVTAACLMTKKEVFEKVKGLEEKFAVAFNDIDYCMKIREQESLVVWTPYAEMYHHESKSRGAEDTPEKIKRFKGEIARFDKKWGLWIEDPYYNKNLTLDREDFSLRWNKDKK